MKAKFLILLAAVSLSMGFVHAQEMPASITFEKDDVRIVVRKVQTESVQGIFAVRFNYTNIKRRKGDTSVALFKLETVKNGSHAWHEILPNTRGVLAINPGLAPTYLSNLVTEGGKRKLILNSAESRFIASYQEEKGTCNWANFKECDKEYCEVNGNDEKGTLKTDRVVFNKTGGEWVLSSFIPGIKIAHQYAYDATTASGQVFDRKITALLIPIDYESFGWDSRILVLTPQRKLERGKKLDDAPYTGFTATMWLLK